MFFLTTVNKHLPPNTKKDFYIFKPEDALSC